MGGKMIIDGNKYIQFELTGDTGKTQHWIVVNKTYGTNLGNISWYSGWRQYTFMPARETEFNDGCLEAIIAFLKRLNKEKRIVLDVPLICHDDLYNVHKQIKA
jgi:hypothetical protein